MSNVITYLVVPADTNVACELVTGEPTLYALQKLVGGWIEHVYIPSGIIIRDEEGAINGSQSNDRANRITKRTHEYKARLFGTVVIYGFDPESGDELDVPKDLLDTIADIIL